MSALRTVACAVLLSAGVAAVVAAGMVRFAPETAPRVGRVRLTDLTAEYLAQTAHDGRSADEIAEGARAWAVQLEMALERVSARRGIVLLPTEAVAAGAPDYTAEVEATMALIAGSGAGDAARASRVAEPGLRP